MSGKQAGGKGMLAGVAASVPPRKVEQDRLGPTPEQRRHGVFRLGDVVDKAANGVTINIGKAYRREPLFETLAKDHRSGIDTEGLRALRYYRARFEETEVSLTRCALDVQGRGGGDTAPLPRGVDPFMFIGAGANRTLDRLEQAMGAVADTVRGVAIEDRSYSDLAIARWGSRKQSWIKQPGRKGQGGKATFSEKIVPKSGRHREAIRQEFLLGLARLVDAVQLLTSNPITPNPTPSPLAEVVLSDEGGVETAASVEALATIDPEFLNEQGHMRGWDEIAAIIRERHCN